MISMIELLQNILFTKMRILVFALAESLTDIKKIYFGFQFKYNYKNYPKSNSSVFTYY